jgi:hypothetical protein
MGEEIQDEMTRMAEAAFRKAAETVVRRARQTGTPVVIWEDGEARLVPPERWEAADAARLPADPKPAE